MKDVSKALLLVGTGLIIIGLIGKLVEYLISLGELGLLIIVVGSILIIGTIIGAIGSLFDSNTPSQPRKPKNNEDKTDNIILSAYLYEAFKEIVNEKK